LVALAFAFPTLGGDGDIGVLFPFLGIVLGPLGFIVGGLLGIAVGWLIGILHRRLEVDGDEPPIAKP